MGRHENLRLWCCYTHFCSKEIELREGEKIAQGHSTCWWVVDIQMQAPVLPIPLHWTHTHTHTHGQQIFTWGSGSQGRHSRLLGDPELYADLYKYELFLPGEQLH